MHRVRSWRALPLLAAMLAVLLACAPSALAHQHSHQPDPHLEILVTNDDGWIGPNGSQTPLIVALRDALAADGNDVTVVAPATNQSGTGTRMGAFAGAVELLNPSPGVWTVGGSPSDAVYLGRYAVFADGAPDLVVSGINPGGNYSSLANHSGTVGAAVAALELGIPGIAVSIDGSGEQSEAAKNAAAEYTADLVDSLAEHARHGELLPPGIGLNVNYPGKAPATGTRITHQDPNSYIGFGFKNNTGALGEPGVYTLALTAPTASPQRGSDWSALAAGKVSITPITADRTATLSSFALRGGLRLWF